VVQAQSITGKDVTAQYIDLKARLENAIGQRTVLRNLMAEATTIQETITVQNRLSQVELEVEQIQGQLTFIDDQVAEATVRVEMHEHDAAQLQQTDAVENPSLGSAWDRSIQGFLNVVSAVVIGLGYLLPLAALGLIVWLITAAMRRRRAAS
jgi:type IV secretory pathway TrbD component